MRSLKYRNKAHKPERQEKPEGLPTMPPRPKGKQMKPTLCVCCSEAVYRSGSWTNHEGYFCSAECVAKWYADETDTIDDEDLPKDLRSDAVENE